MSSRNEDPTVYSTAGGRICPKCGQPVERCTCKRKSAPVVGGDGRVRVQRESKGRGGKVVTLVTGLALDEEGLKKLAGELKRACGAGGAVKDGVIEIQGDKRDRVVEVLKKQGYPAKRAG